MAKNKQPLVIGAALIFLLVGCESGGGPDMGTSSDGTQPAALNELDSISVAGDPLADIAGPVKIISELQYGQSRLIAYVNGDSCGILATSKGDVNVNRIHLVSKWPARGEGTNNYPAGPYNSASGAGDPQSWASLLCSKNAMVFEYASGEGGAPEQARGPVTATQVADRPATTRIVVGDAEVRKQIENHVKGSASAQ
ncbi:hypothetical protein [Streptomyces subrutilus]|uniref:hypothetical protein n=1 Tax=Streptomyces subrutilus TaxID=36818 RepID=UPI00114D30E9|nr:hypothetical protein [Streptomyces subrutilus]